MEGALWMEEGGGGGAPAQDTTGQASRKGESKGREAAHFANVACRVRQAGVLCAW